MVLVPTLVWYVTIAFGPIVRAFWMAVIDYKLLDPSASEFVGLKNFRLLFDYDLFWTSAVNTLRFAAYQYISILPLATIIAYCLSHVLRGRRIYEFVVFLPVVVSLVAVALLFRTLMDPQIGVFNRVLRSLGLPTSRWLTGPESALASVAAVSVWKDIGFYVVLITAGFLNIPSEMYDAAKVDGANPWQTFWRVTMPLMSHTYTLVAVLLAIFSVQVYTSVVVMTGGGWYGDTGGPANATYVINLLVVREAFTGLRFGFATAASFSLFLFILVVTIIQLRVTRTGWEY
jgi:multiple sugar transport system permease protein